MENDLSLPKIWLYYNGWIRDAMWMRNQGKFILLLQTKEASSSIKSIMNAFLHLI